MTLPNFLQKYASSIDTASKNSAQKSAFWKICFALHLLCKGHLIKQVNVVNQADATYKNNGCKATFTSSKRN